MERVNVVPQLASDDREIGEGGMKDGISEPGMAREDKAEHGNEDEKEREDRQEGRVRKTGDQAAGVIVTELLGDPEQERQRSMTLLEAIDPTGGLFDWIHNVPSPRSMRWGRDPTPSGDGTRPIKVCLLAKFPGDA
jgi:hypothetical protein